MKPRAKIALSLFSAWLCLAVAGNLSSAQDADSEWNGSSISVSHLFRVFDEERHVIVPTVPGAMPMSSRWTCGTCHDYKTISKGFHFNAGAPDAPAGRPGEPWVWVDEKTGTALPISERGWPGTYKPEQLGISPWRMTQLFGRSMTGGGIAEPKDKDALADPHARWDLSGKVEINCMACHNQAHGQDLSEWARQMERENFRWAATAAAGMGEVGGMASRLRDSWMVHDGPSPDDRQFALPPSVNYDTKKFDAKGRYDFQVGHPTDESCLQCHSTGVVGLPRAQHPVDVHTAAGLKCVDCHKESLAHDTMRGYEGEAAERVKSKVDPVTCAGCHYQTGQYGAKRPLHKGIPPIHLEKLSCTACHSGLKNDITPENIRTSRAHRLGIYGRAAWATDTPNIVETAFVRNEKGKIEPRKLMWPSFWAQRDKSGKLTPITPDQLTTLTVGILDAPQQVQAVLAAFAQARTISGTPLIGVDGKWFESDPNDVLRVSDARTSSTFTGIRWGVKVDGAVRPFLSTFDAKAETLDADAETSITEILRALKTLGRPGQPELIAGGRSFRRSGDGTLQRTETALMPEPAWDWVAPDDRSRTELIGSAAKDVFQTVGTPTRLTTTQAEQLIERAKSNGLPDLVYVAGGRAFSSTGPPNVAYPAAQPYSWPIAHAVRPASQALGARGCTDCHSEKSPFFFATLTGQGPLATSQTAVIPMSQLEKLDPTYMTLFARSFVTRPYFKLAGWGLFALLAVTLLVFALRGLAGVARWFGGARMSYSTAIIIGLVAAVILGLASRRRPLPVPPPRERFPSLAGALALFTFLAILLLAVTGFAPSFLPAHPLSAYSLLGHMVGGAMLFLLLPAVAIARGEQFSSAAIPAPQRFFFWCFLLFGLFSGVTILLSMTPLYGPPGITQLIGYHRWTSLLTMVSFLAFIIGRLSKSGV